MHLSPDWIITPAELEEQRSAVTVVDVREPEEYAQAHIPGCKLIPLGELEERAPRELKQDAEIVLYCAHGIRSLEALFALRMLGYAKLRSLEGGIEAWESHKKSSNPAR